MFVGDLAEEEKCPLHFLNDFAVSGFWILVKIPAFGILRTWTLMYLFSRNCGIKCWFILSTNAVTLWVLFNSLGLISKASHFVTNQANGLSKIYRKFWFAYINGKTELGQLDNKPNSGSLKDFCFGETPLVLLPPDWRTINIVKTSLFCLKGIYCSSISLKQDVRTVCIAKGSLRNVYNRISVQWKGTSLQNLS